MQHHPPPGPHEEEFPTGQHLATIGYYKQAKKLMQFLNITA